MPFLHKAFRKQVLRGVLPSLPKYILMIIFKISGKMITYTSPLKLYIVAKLQLLLTLMFYAWNFNIIHYTKDK